LKALAKFTIGWKKLKKLSGIFKQIMSECEIREDKLIAEFKPLIFEANIM